MRKAPAGAVLVRYLTFSFGPCVLEKVSSLQITLMNRLLFTTGGSRGKR